MKTRYEPNVSSETPIVRVRVRELWVVRHDGDRSAPSTVFCPERSRTIAIDTCRDCPRFSRLDGGTVECAPVTRERSGWDPLTSPRLGGDACVGEAMGYFAVSVQAHLAAGVLAHRLRREGVVLAIVVNDGGRLVGLVDAAAATQAIGSVRAHELARPCDPIRESAPLADAVAQMVRKRARALPVVDDDGRVVALLTDLDALRWVARRRSGSR
jgi:CBS domain-containing protein